MDFNMDIDIDIDSDIDDNELQTLLRQFDNSTLIPIDISLMEKLLREHEELVNISEPPVKPEEVTETYFDEQHNNQSRDRDLHSEVANVGRNLSDVSEPRHSSNAESLHKDHNTRQQDSSTKQFICDICRKSFAHKSHLKRHMRSHSGEKPYPCKECNKTFRQSIHLKIHQLVHTGEKPYSCFQCKKSFTKKCNLSSHQRTHTGEKPYSCRQCMKTFSLKCNLKEHQLIHTGGKPHSCSLCKKPFAYKSTLNRHMRSHKDEHRKL